MTFSKTFSASMENNGGRNIILNTQAVHKYKMMNIKPVIDTKSPYSYSKKESLCSSRKIKNPDPSLLFSNFQFEQRPKSVKRSKRTKSSQSARKSIRGKEYTSSTNLHLNQALEKNVFVALNQEQQKTFDAFALMLTEFSTDDCEKITRELWRTVTERKLLSRFGEDPSRM